MLCLKKQMSAFYEIEMDKILTAFSEMDRPVNLSYWNSGSEYKAQLKKILKFDTERDFLTISIIFLNVFIKWLPTNSVFRKNTPGWLESLDFPRVHFLL